MDEKHLYLMVNLLLKILILVVVSGIAVVVWCGIKKLHQEVFGIKVVFAEMTGYIKEAK